MISSKSVPTCNRFHARQANSSKIMGVLFFMPFFDGNPPNSGEQHEILSRKLEFCGSHSEDFVILSCTVFIRELSVADRPTP